MWNYHLIGTDGTNIIRENGPTMQCLNRSYKWETDNRLIAVLTGSDRCDPLTEAEALVAIRKITGNPKRTLKD